MTEQVQINLRKPRKAHLAYTILENNYDPNQHPPNFVLAKEHLYANRVYKKLEETQRLGQVCPCCNHPIINKQLSICCSRNELFHLGSSISLFFQFIIFGIIVLLIILGIMGIYALTTNFIQNDCDSTKWESGGIYSNSSQAYANDCDWSYVTVWSVASKRYNDQYKEIQSWLMLVSCCVLILVFQIYRKVQRKSLIDCDIEILTPADYTLKATNFPKNAKIEEIKDWFNEKMRNIQIQAQTTRSVSTPVVEKINMIYDISNYVHFQKTKTQLLNKKFNELDAQKIEEIDRELNAIEGKITREESRIEDQGFTGIVFVTFNLPKVRDRFLSIYKLDIFHRLLIHIGLGYIFESKSKFKKQKILIYSAPEPSDILWENMNYSFMTRMKYQTITKLIAAIIITITCGILVFISYLKFQLLQEDNVIVTQKILELLASLLVLLVNTVLTMIIRKLSEYEKPITQTNHYLNVAQRLCFALFINIAIALLLATFIIESYGSLSENSKITKKNTTNLWTETGFLDNLWYIFLSNAFVTPLAIILDPWWFYRKYKRSRLLKQGSKCTLTQKQVHTWFEGQNYDIAYRYAVVMKTIWLSAFYASVLPMGIIVSLIELLVYYWIQKYVLLRRCKMPNEMYANIRARMASFLEFTPFIYAIGSLYFNKITMSSASNIHPQLLPNIIAVVGMGFYIILPTNIFATLCCKDTGEDIHQIPYDEARIKFSSDYGIMNPITHKKELIEWLEFHANFEKNERITYRYSLMLDEIRNKPKINLENYTESDLNSPNYQKNFPISSRKIYFISPSIPKNLIFNSTHPQYSLKQKKINSQVNNGFAKTPQNKYPIKININDSDHYQNSEITLNSSIVKMFSNDLPNTDKEEDSDNLARISSISKKVSENKGFYHINFSRIFSLLSQNFGKTGRTEDLSSVKSTSKKSENDCNINDTQLTFNSYPDKVYQIQRSIKNKDYILNHLQF